MRVVGPEFEATGIQTNWSAELRVLGKLGAWLGWTWKVRFRNSEGAWCARETCLAASLPHPVSHPMAGWVLQRLQPSPGSCSRARAVAAGPQLLPEALSSFDTGNAGLGQAGE